MPTAPLRNVIDHLRTAGPLQEALTQTDGQLLERFAAARDDIAFEALVRRHGPMVLGVCRRLLPNSYDAEDAFQATFLVLVRKAPAIFPREKVANWLYGVAYRAAQKARANIARRQQRERHVQSLPEPGTVADGIWHDLLPELDDELSRLPDKYRLPLVLCDLEGRTRTEAAEQLHWPEGTVAGRLVRARVLLAGRLARHGLPVTAGVLTALLAQNAASAALPLALVTSTVRAATALAAGAATAASTVALALAAEVLRATGRRKLLAAASVVVVMAALGISVVVSPGVRPDAPTVAKTEPPPEKSPPGDRNTDRPEDAVVKELKALQGDWKVVRLETDERKASPKELEGMRWTFKGNRLWGNDPGEKSRQFGEVRLDPTKAPKQIDLIGQERDVKDKPMQGIYKLENGRLTICLRDEKSRDKGRPTTFSADAGSGQAIIVLESLGAPAKAPEKP